MAPRKDLETEWAYYHKIQVTYKTHIKLRDFYLGFLYTYILYLSV